MHKEIDDLVASRDATALYELMVAGDDEFIRLDAAEGLLRLGDPRGLKFLENALESDERDVREFAEDVMESPEIQHLIEQVEAESDRAHDARVAAAKARIAKGGKVYRYKVIFVPAMDLMQEDLGGQGVNLLDLDEAGLEGWEVVNLVARRQLIMDINDKASGAYALLKKVVGPDEAAELDQA